MANGLKEKMQVNYTETVLSQTWGILSRAFSEILAPRPTTATPVDIRSIQEGVVAKLTGLEDLGSLTNHPREISMVELRNLIDAISSCDWSQPDQLQQFRKGPHVDPLDRC